MLQFIDCYHQRFSDYDFHNMTSSWSNTGTSSVLVWQGLSTLLWSESPTDYGHAAADNQADGFQC
jgi:hypothetical protein